MKKISLMLAVCVMVSLCVPATFAANRLDDIVLSVKNRVNIPVEYSEFESFTQTHNGHEVYSFQWSTPDGAEKYGNASVRVSDSGIISDYSIYNQRDYSRDTREKQIPKISKEQAVQAAGEYMAKINPDISAEYVLSDKAEWTNENYIVNGKRMHGSIPVHGDEVSLRISTADASLSSMSLSYTENVEFPSVDNVLTSDGAKKAFKENCGLELIYVDFYSEKEDLTAYAVYEETGKSKVIDAVTGKPVELSYIHDRIAISASGNMKEEALSDKSRLTDKEIKKIEEIKGLITPEKAIEIVTSNKMLDIRDDFKNINSNVYKSGDKYVIAINADANKKDEKYSYISASLNAKTGELISFHAGYSDDQSMPLKGIDETLKIGESIPGAMLPDIAANLILSDRERKPDNNDSCVYFNWNRLNNGILYRGNNVNVGIDRRTGKIIYFNKNYDYNKEFESGSFIDSDTAYSKYFEYVTPELCYVNVGKDSPSFVPAYITECKSAMYIKASDGKFVGGDGREYKAHETKAYNDIETHYAKDKIIALWNIGIGFERDSFEPDKIITQGEFISLVSQSVMSYYPIMYGRANVDMIYKNAISSGIIEEEEKDPDKELVRERAVMYILRAMGYKKLAEIPGIFKCDFSDADQISEDMFGYVSIAKGLKIISGSDGAFMPKKTMTRAEAAVMIYNYLK